MNVRYVPGDPVVAVTGRAVVMTAPDRVAEVSALVDGTPTPLGVISALSGGDVARLPDFAAAVIDGTDLVVLVRGPYSVRSGDQEWSGRDVATWREHRVPAGDEVRIDHGDVAGDPELPLTTGVVLASRVIWQTGTASEADEPQQPAARDPEATVTGVDEPEPSAAGEAAATEATEAAVAGAGAEADTVAVEDDFDETVGATIQGQREADPVEGDHDGRTITAEQMRALRAGKDPDTRETALQVSATLAVSGGETVDLAKPVVLGRSPRAQQKSGAQLPRMMVLDDPYVSGTHLEVALEGGVVVATDRSTNGTMLIRPGGGSQRLPKDEPTVIDDGCVLQLSDDVTATVSVQGAAG